MSKCRRLLLHIGHFKTGTTALQEYCQRNRSALAEAGICYPNAGVILTPNGQPNGNHGVFALGLLEAAGLAVPHWYRQWVALNPHAFEPTAQWQLLQTEIEESKCDTVLLSSEFLISFSRGPKAQQSFQQFLTWIQPYHVEVVCYLRRPDRMIESFYNQIVKTGHTVARLYDNVERYRTSHFLDSARALRPWVNAFGIKHLQVRNFDRLQNSDIIPDFFSTIGFPTLAELTRNEIHLNPRLHNAFVELKRLTNHGGLNNREVCRIDAAFSWMEANFQLPPHGMVRLLSNSDIRFLDGYTDRQNAQLLKLLGDSVEHPFFPPNSDSLESAPDVLSDIEAAYRYAGLFSLALHLTRPQRIRPRSGIGFKRKPHQYANSNHVGEEVSQPNA